MIKDIDILTCNWDSKDLSNDWTKMDLLDVLNDWAMGIHPVFNTNKFQKYVLEYIEKARNPQTEEFFCMSKMKSFWHAAYFLRRHCSFSLKDEKSLDHYYTGIFIPHELRQDLENDYEENWAEYDAQKSRERVKGLRGKFKK